MDRAVASAVHVDVVLRTLVSYYLDNQVVLVGAAVERLTEDERE